MTEKDRFLQAFAHEAQTTIKILKAYPSNKADFKPHEKSRSAKELGWTFVMEQGIADMALKGRVDFSQQMPPAPANFDDVIAAFEGAVRETTGKVSNASDTTLNQTVQFPVGPGRMGEFRAIDILWTSLMDQIHHRGQFSVYLRLAGAKVPSIYGPTADEPWM